MNRLPYKDIHTHIAGRKDAVLNVDPTVDGSLPTTPCSVAIHPWHSDHYDEGHWRQLETWAADERVVAIGECGLDRQRGASHQEQLQLLRRHARLAETVGKPLILHMVGGWYDLLRLHRELAPAQPWIVHGFRGKPELARQLLRQGLCLSFGEKFNAASVAVTPLERMYFETDESTLDIEEIRRRILAAHENHI